MATTIGKAKTIYVSQPDPSTCQSACIAMVLRTTDVDSIRADLEVMGMPGDPAVMEQYLRPRVDAYSFLLTGSLNDAKTALDDGYAVITHGWFTEVGHVIVLIGYEHDPKTMSYRFIVHDPFAEYDFSNSNYDESKSGEAARYSSYGMYAYCVASAGYTHADEIYYKKRLSSSEKNAWLHIIKN